MILYQYHISTDALCCTLMPHHLPWRLLTAFCGAEKIMMELFFAVHLPVCIRGHKLKSACVHQVVFLEPASVRQDEYWLPHPWRNAFLSLVCGQCGHCPCDPCQGKYVANSWFRMHSIKASSEQAVSNPTRMCLLMTRFSEYLCKSGSQSAAALWWCSQTTAHTVLSWRGARHVCMSFVHSVFNKQQGEWGWREVVLHACVCVCVCVLCVCVCVVGGGFWTLS